MTIAILVIILIGYVLIASEHITHVNKATIAMFAAVVGWILFISAGTFFVMKMHGGEFAAFVGAAEGGGATAKEFIASHVFVGYAADLCATVLYLLATMTIAGVLHANGCLDFIAGWLRTRNSRRLLWTLAGATLFVSAHLDNLTTTVMMLMLMRSVVSERRWRVWYGAAVVIAANCGGAATVIGDVTSLVVWSKGAVTPTAFSAAMALPVLVAVSVSTALIGRALPEGMSIVRPTAVFRGDASPLRLWQRIVMLVIGFGGLWFIPSFHRITLLPPFLGALCVLGVLWVVNEVFNYRRIQTDQPMSAGESDRQFQYSGLQTLMYFVGVYLCVGLLIETGVMGALSAWCDRWIHNIYIMSMALGLISAVLDNIALVLTATGLYPVATDTSLLAGITDTAYAEAFLPDGQYWQLIVYSGCVAGCLLPIGTVSGYALMKAEQVSIAWYARNIMPKVLAGWMLGLGCYFLINHVMSA